MKALYLGAAVLALAGCDAFRAAAPNTAAGFDAGGIVGALDGATGAIIAKCRTLDGEVVRVAIGDIADETDGESLVESVRERRQRACRIASGIRVLADPELHEPVEKAASAEQTG